MLQRARADALLPALDALIASLVAQAPCSPTSRCSSRTHGQTASPTTLGRNRQRRRAAAARRAAIAT